MRSLIKFFLLTFIVSWVLWIAAAAISGGTFVPGRTPGLYLFGRLVVLVGVFSPALVALVLTNRAEGRAGVVTLLHRILRWQVCARWYVFAVSYFVAIKLTVALGHRIVTGAWPAFGQTPFYVLLVAIIFSTPSQAGEEIGWRGFALPRLAKTLGLGGAGIVLGIIWACWHLPFFFIPGSDNAGQSFPVYLLAVTAISVAMAWLYWRTNGSLLLTMLMHAAINNTAGIVPSPASTANPFALKTSILAWLTAAVLWLSAAYFLIRMRGAALPQSQPATGAQLCENNCS
jgi:membrane protease YdiL (CAAX protease family)